MWIELQLLINSMCVHDIVLAKSECWQGKVEIIHVYKYDCWPLPSNQCFYRQIAGYEMSVGDHRVG